MDRRQPGKQCATGTLAKRCASQRPDTGHEELDSMQALLYDAFLESTMPEQCRRRRTHQQLANASPSDESLSFFKNPSKTCRLRRRFPQFLLAHRFAIFRTSWWSRRFFYLPALLSARLPDGWRSARHKRILFACRVGANAIFPSRVTPTSLSLQTGLCPIFDPSCTSLGTPCPRFGCSVFMLFLRPVSTSFRVQFSFIISLDIALLLP